MKDDSDEVIPVTDSATGDTGDTAAIQAESEVLEFPEADADTEAASETIESATPVRHHPRQSVIALATVLIGLVVLLNWPLSYTSVNETGDIEALIDFRSIEARLPPTMAGWPCHFWIHYDQRGSMPALSVFSFLGLIINLSVAIGVGGLLLLYVYRRGLRNPGGKRTNINIADLLLVTLALAAPFGWWQYQKAERKKLGELSQRCATRGDSLVVASWVPQIIQKAIPDWLSSELVKVRGIRLEDPTDKTVAQAVAIPTLTSFRIGGGNYDLRLLDELGKRVHLADLRVAGRTIDTPLIQLIASTPRLQTLNLMRTNVSTPALLAMGDLSGLRRLNLMHTDVRLEDLGRPSWADSIEVMIVGHPDSGVRDSLTIEKWPRLRELSINELDTQLNGAEMKVRLVGLPELKHLELDRFQAFDLTLQDLPSLSKIKDQTDNWESRIARGGTMPGATWLAGFDGQGLPQLTGMDYYVGDLKSFRLREASAFKQLGVAAFRSAAAQTYYSPSGTSSSYDPKLSATAKKALIEGIGASEGPMMIDLDAVPLKDADLTPLAANKQIRELMLANTQTNRKQWKQLAEMTQLRHLRLSGNAVAPDDVEFLLDQFPNLEVLEFGNTDDGSFRVQVYGSRNQKLELVGRPKLRSITIDDSMGGMYDTVRIVDMPSLQTDLNFGWINRELEIRNSPSLTGFSLDAPLPPKTTLRDLRDLTYFAVGGKSIDDAILEQIKPCKQLTKLTLAHVSASPDALAELPLASVASLYLPGCRVDDDVVAQWPSLAQLSSLDLSDTRISGASLGPLLKSDLLQSVNLNRCPIESKDLTPLATKDVLASLSLAGIGIDSKTLDALLQHGMLRNLDLSGTNVSAEMMVALINSGHSLEFLSVRDCTLDSKAIFAFVQKNRSVIIDPTGSDLDTDLYTKLLSQRRIMEAEDYRQQKAMQAAMTAAQSGARVGYRSYELLDSIINTDVFSPKGRFGEEGMATAEMRMRRMRSNAQPSAQPSVASPPSSGAANWLKRMISGSPQVIENETEEESESDESDPDASPDGSQPADDTHAVGDTPARENTPAAGAATTENNESNAEQESNE